MKKPIISFLTLTFLLFSACGENEPLGYKLKKLNKQNENLITQTSQEEINQWETYTSEKYGFHFKHPSVFLVTEKDSFLNLVFKNQSQENVFLSIAKQPENNSEPLATKDGKNLNSKGIAIKIENTPFAEGWIDRNGSFKFRKDIFIASHILSVDIPKMDELDGQNYATEIDKILLSLEGEDIDELAKKEIKLFDTIIATIESNNGFVIDGQTASVPNEGIIINFTDELNDNDNQGIAFGPKGFLPESSTDKKYEAPIYYLALRDKRSGEKIISAAKKIELLSFGPIKKQTNGFEFIEWAEGGLCERRTAEIIGTKNNLQFTSSGCHNSESKTDFDYFENVINGIKSLKQK